MVTDHKSVFVGILIERSLRERHQHVPSFLCSLVGRLRFPRPPWPGQARSRRSTRIILNENLQPISLYLSIRRMFLRRGPLGYYVLLYAILTPKIILAQQWPPLVEEQAEEAKYKETKAPRLAIGRLILPACPSAETHKPLDNDDH